jgi:hypothetical protein
LVCSECGKRLDGDPRRKTCSDACRSKRSRRKGLNISAFMRALRAPNFCSECGEVLDHDPRRKTCSDACRSKRSRRRNTAQGQDQELTAQIADWGLS